jgi:hypothetical protein
MPIYNKPLPANLKKNEPSDYITINGANKEVTVISKQETKLIINELIMKECESSLKKATRDLLLTYDKMIDENIKPDLDEKFLHLQKEVVAYIDFKLDILSQKICDLLITRKLNEEVDKKVSEKLQQARKGKF